MLQQESKGAVVPNVNAVEMLVVTLFFTINTAVFIFSCIFLCRPRHMQPPARRTKTTQSPAPDIKEARNRTSGRTAEARSTRIRLPRAPKSTVEIRSQSRLVIHVPPNMLVRLTKDGKDTGGHKRLAKNYLWVEDTATDGKDSPVRQH